jgi:type II secretory pathway pseudopilin PulG
MIKLFKKHNGFTLIETIIYIGIFALIMSSAVVSIYSIMSNNARNQTKAMVEEEGSFLIGKIDWALIGTKKINSSNGNTLSVTKFDSAIPDPIEISVEDGKMKIKKGGGGDTIELNNSNITVSCPPSGCFIHGVDPEKIEANITINTKTSEGLPFSQDFYTIKYLRR